MPLYIKGDDTAALVAQLAKLRGLTKQAVVKLAAQAELDRATQDIPLRDRFAALRAAYPLPPPTGELADTAFFDELSGEEPCGNHVVGSGSVWAKVGLRGLATD